MEIVIVGIGWVLYGFGCIDLWGYVCIGCGRLVGFLYVGWVFGGVYWC